MTSIYDLFVGFRLFFITFARVAALLQTAPVTSSGAISLHIRGVLAFFVSLILFPLVENSYGSIPPNSIAFVYILIAEILLGILTGLFLQIVFAVFQTAGQLFSIQMGFSASQVFDPLAQIQIPLLGQFFNLVGLSVFLSVNGLSRMVLHALATSFKVMKGTDFLLARTWTMESFIRAMGGLFEQAFLLAFPIIGTLFLVSISMGMLTKAAPQMNLLVLGFPIQIAVGIIMILMAMPLLVEYMSRIVDFGFKTLENYFIATREAFP